MLYLKKVDFDSEPLKSVTIDELHSTDFSKHKGSILSNISVLKQQCQQAMCWILQCGDSDRFYLQYL